MRGGINARGAAVATGCPSRALPVSCFPSLLFLLSLLFSGLPTGTVAVAGQHKLQVLSALLSPELSLLFPRWQLR